MNELIDIAKDNIPWLFYSLIFISMFFEFSKIKINPISWLFKTLSNKITEDIRQDNLSLHQENKQMKEEMNSVYHIKSKHYEEICQWRHDINDIVKGLEDVNSKLVITMNNMNDKIDEMYESQDENEMHRMRWEILSFSDSIAGGSIHSKDAFDHIFDINDKYHKIIEKRNYVNGRIDAEMEYITKVYKKLLEEDGFY